MAPQDDLTAAERAAAEDVYYGLQVMNTPDYNLREADTERDIQAILTLIRQTRQEALREASRMADEYGAKEWDKGIQDAMARLSLRLDRLASEGGT